jgi:MarR family transcriptional regulator, organic hydroperoxide resistance regulator
MQKIVKRKANKKRPARSERKQALTVTLPELLVDGSDEQFRSLVADLFAAVAGMQSLRRALANAAEISTAEFSILLATWNLQKSGRVGVSTIAKHLHVAPAHVTTEVGNLVVSGLLHKKQASQDTRAVDLTVTRQGEAVLNTLAPLLRRINDRLFAGNRADAIPVISKFLRHLVAESSNSIRMAQQFKP